MLVPSINTEAPFTEPQLFCMCLYPFFIPSSVRSVPEAMQNTAVGWMSKVSEKSGKQAKEPKEVKAKGSPKQQSSFHASQELGWDEARSTF